MSYVITIPEGEEGEEFDKEFNTLADLLRYMDGLGCTLDIFDEPACLYYEFTVPFRGSTVLEIPKEVAA